MSTSSRRDFLRTAATHAASAGLALNASRAAAQIAGDRPRQDSAVKVLLPQNRVPVSLIIDDSTCLVNSNRFSIPQFRAASNNGRYFHDWRSWPHEIPDSFVRKFGEWCHEQGVRGKYSIVPYPSCVGRVDRELPGWTRRELDDSLNLVRTLMMPDWDIHPEMITHTRVIDTKTGHPYPHIGREWIENWNWTDGKSVDHLADYISYALRILKNVGLPCEGITTPGDFGQNVLPELAQATLESCRDVFQAEIPHYFRHSIREGSASVAPRIEYASGIDGPDPRCVVSIIACTGDWTGGWDCSSHGDADLFITADLDRGRLVDVIDRGEPALLLAHWTGIYFNGQEIGFRVFQEVVRRLHAKYDNLIWMKNSEIARYWAARELTLIEAEGTTVSLQAPYQCPGFTLRLPQGSNNTPRLVNRGRQSALREVNSPLRLEPGTWVRQDDGTIACFDLPNGRSRLEI